MTDYVDEEHLDSYFYKVMVKAVEDADYTEELTDFAGVASRRSQQAFETQQSPSGHPWPQWELSREYMPPSKDTLIESGLLKESLVPGGPQNHFEVDKNSMEFGTNVPYASVHQVGGKSITNVPLYGREGNRVPPGTEIMHPARPFVGVQVHDVDELADAVAARAIQAMKDK